MADLAEQLAGAVKGSIDPDALVTSLSEAKGVPLTASKVTKDSANYRPADEESEQSCANCRFYGNHTCSRVKGRIEPDWTSDLWAPKK